MKKTLTATAAMSLCALAAWAHAAGDAARLGKDLNPMGGEMQGSKDGAIPAWTGEEVFPGWSSGKSEAAAYKYRDDKVLFTIDASNVDKYADKLAPGQIKLIKSYNTKLPVYPSRRTCRALDFVAANTKTNATASKIGADGWSLTGAVLPGIPFPMPTNGVELVWNHLTRYQGVATEWKNITVYISPRPGSDSDTRIVYNNDNYFPYSAKGANRVGSGPYYTYVAGYSAPAALSGQLALQQIYLDKPTDTYYYFPGQRRVRRLPSYDYDTQNLGFEGLLPVDTGAVFMGAPDRFDWKIVGKKEMYVNVNNFAFTDPSVKFDEVIKRDHIEPSALHYELRRVWVVQATVKPGLRHINPKRTFYFDEDSGIAVGGDDYDAQGKLVRWKESAQSPEAQIGGQCQMVNYRVHDLETGRYVLDNVVFGGGSKKNFIQTDSPKFRPSYYTQENLQRMGDR
jgi:hypothetical protein